MHRQSITLQDDPDLQGRFGSITLTDVLQLLGGSNQTGTLSLTQGWNGRTITYQEGRVSYIAAVTPIPDAAALLVAAGRIDDRTADLARREHARRQDLSLEDVLRSMKLASEDDLKQCYDQQIEELLYTFFLWRECRFAFRSGEVVAEGGMVIDMSMEHLILEGLRVVDEWIAISPLVPSIRMVFQKTETAPKGPMSSDLISIYRQVNGVADVAGLAKLCGVTQYQCAKALHELGTAGLVYAVPPNKILTIRLFNDLVESIYTKLSLFGYQSAAREFMEQLNSFSREHGLKVRMRGGKVELGDEDLHVDTVELIDKYRTFLAVQANKFERTFDPTVVRGLVSGFYAHLPPDRQALMGVYDFVRIEGLFDQLRAHRTFVPPDRLGNLMRTRR